MCIRDRYQRRVRGTNRAKMAAVRVAVLDGPGINPGCLHWSMQCLEQDQDILATVITPDQIKIPGSLDEFEVFYCPGGSHQGVFNLLGVNGREAIREFVSHGGGLVGICGGAYFIHRMELANIHVHGTNYATDVLHGAHGDAYLETLQGFAETYPTTEWGPESWLMFSSGPLMGPREAGVLCDDRCGIVEPIALFANDILGDMREQIEFLEQRLRETGLWVCLEEHGGDGPCENVSSHSNCHLCGEPKPKWHSTNLLVPEDKKPPVGLMPSTWAIVRSTFGMGKVIAMSPHPEFTEGKFEMLGSSIRWVRPAEDTPLMLGPEAVTPNSAQLAHASALCRVPSSIAEPEDDSVFGCAVSVGRKCRNEVNTLRRQAVMMMPAGLSEFPGGGEGGVRASGAWGEPRIPRFQIERAVCSMLGCGVQPCGAEHGVLELWRRRVREGLASAFQGTFPRDRAPARGGTGRHELLVLRV
eukprot:TRINITY_DN7289_c0_g1_i7.p1 TRINITY_DN7289_c0_g1~~TRINITY_DN7289_c0_g1_i7.p1  ORF type:complete len:471 (-),score=64.21 TRINITY_DN7289_c0_g1_i7:528-1940(-)